MRFAAIVTPQATAKGRRVFMVSFPSCPGCATEVDSEAEILPMAQEALEGWIESRLAHGGAPDRQSAFKGDRLEWVEIPARLAVKVAIRWARLDAGLTQAELAQRTGVTRQQIAKIEQPDANLTLDTLEKISGALGLPLEVRIGFQIGQVVDVIEKATRKVRRGRFGGVRDGRLTLHPLAEGSVGAKGAVRSAEMSLFDVAIKEAVSTNTSPAALKRQYGKHANTWGLVARARK